MAIGHGLGKGVIALEIVPIGIGTAVGMCCRYQRPWPASTRFVKAAGVNTRKKINSLVFIILDMWLVRICYCKYTHFLVATEKKIVGLKKSCNFAFYLNTITSNEKD